MGVIAPPKKMLRHQTILLIALLIVGCEELWLNREQSKSNGGKLWIK